MGEPVKSRNWDELNRDIIECQRCPRLRQHCSSIASTKRKAFVGEKYWGKPVPAFGASAARLVIIGLAPAAHGANRTGRIFTGDRSGEWLYRALYKAGFANQPTSTHLEDGLQLLDAYITATVKCAPPDNKPTLAEIAHCLSYLRWEIEHLTKARVYLALGKIGFDQAWNILKLLGEAKGSRPPFKHNHVTALQSGRHLLSSYHPSQQNTFTGKLTEPMFDAIFSKARNLLK